MGGPGGGETSDGIENSRKRVRIPSCRFLVAREFVVMDSELLSYLCRLGKRSMGMDFQTFVSSGR